VALAYNFGTKKKDDLKIRVNCYELGGGRILSNMLQAPLSAKNIPDIASLCICVDLSKPGNVIDSLLFWLNAAREHSGNAIKDLQNIKVEAFGAYRKEADDYWKNVPAANEKNQLKINLIPMTVICTKYDIYA